MFEQELQKGTTPFLILALLEAEPRHGYELSKLIERRSRGTLTIHAASLYPLLYRLERQGLVKGRWVEREGQRRRRYYGLTAAGSRELEAKRRSWREFVAAVGQVAGVSYA